MSTSVTRNRKKRQHNGHYYLILVMTVLSIFFIEWQVFKTPSTTANWVTEKQRVSTAEFHGDTVTVHNIRNFRYNGSEEDKDIQVGYYDKTYDLRNVKKVWYITEPFTGLNIAAHTFISFEFTTGDFLSISIEAREQKGQTYNLFKGMINTYPLMYIAADERDALYVRTNLRKSSVYVYPVRLLRPENGSLILTDMLRTMNDLVKHPRFYNTIWANCTSLIAYHVNKISPHRLPFYPWQVLFTGYADELALKRGLLDTKLSLTDARRYYYVTKKAQEIGNPDDFSTQIRQFDTN